MWWTKKRLEWKTKSSNNIDLKVVNKRKAIWKPLSIMIPAIIILTIFTIIPFIYTVQDGFHYKEPGSGLAAKGELSLRTFKFVAKDPLFITGIKNSVLYAFIAVPLIIIVSLIFSSAISSVLRKRLQRLFQTIFFLPYVTSAIAVSLAFAFIFSDMASNPNVNGLINWIIIKTGGHPESWLHDTEGYGALKVMLVFGVWKGLAFNILIFTTAMLGVDKTQYKSASIDGAGPVRQFFKITLPSINRTTNFLIIMGIIGSIKVFPLALFNNDAREAMQYNGSTIMLYIYQMVATNNPGKAGVASIFLLLISIGYTIIVKGGFNKLVQLGGWIGEKRVSNKIKSKRLLV